MTTSITEVRADRISVRGFDLAQDVIGSTSVSEFFYMLLTGARPTAVQVDVLDACIVAIAEHGMVPSVQAARMTLASAPESLHGAVAAGLLGCGSVILGSSEETGRVLSRIVAARRAGVPLRVAARDELVSRHAAHLSVPGVGHPIHRQADPRADALLALGDRLGASGEYMAALRAMVAEVEDVYGRWLPLNASGVIPALLMDVGFPLAALKGVPLLGRTMSLVTHLLEEQANSLGFRLAAVADEAVSYTPD